MIYSIDQSVILKTYTVRSLAGGQTVWDKAEFVYNRSALLLVLVHPVSIGLGYQASGLGHLVSI